MTHDDLTPTPPDARPALIALLDARAQQMARGVDVVHQGDALAVLRRMPSEFVDLVVTSPPYDKLRAYTGFSFPFEPIAQELFRVLKKGGVCVWVVGDSVVNGSETLTSFRQAIYFVDVVGFKMHDTMIYGKDGLPFSDVSRYYQTSEYMFVMSKGRPKTIHLLVTRTTHVNKTFSTTRQADGTTERMKYELGKETRVLPNIWLLGTGYMKSTLDKVAYDHPAIFPDELARRHILTWSNPGDIVLDPLMGSRTTCVAARRLGRHYIGCDNSPTYVEIARHRLALPYTPDLFETVSDPSAQDAAHVAQLALPGVV